MGEEAMTLTDEGKYWIEAAIEESFEHQFTNVIQRVRRINESHGTEHLPMTTSSTS